jgi:hypothetical protein
MPSSSTPGVVNGSIDNMLFAVADSIAFPGTAAIGVDIGMWSEAGTCGETRHHPGETALLLHLSDTTTGTYQAGGDSGTKYAEVSAVIWDAQCVNTYNDLIVQTGSVTLTKVDGGVFVGSFDVTLGADHITGEFSAVECDWTPPQTPLPCGP